MIQSNSREPLGVKVQKKDFYVTAKDNVLISIGRFEGSFLNTEAALPSRIEQKRLYIFNMILKVLASIQIESSRLLEVLGLSILAEQFPLQFLRLPLERRPE